MLELLAGWTVGLQMLSFHDQVDNVQFKTITPGIYASSPEGYTAGIYRNSIGKTSLFAGKAFKADFSLAGEEYSVMLGGVTGYNGVAVAPMIVPSIKIDKFRFCYVPPYEKKGFYQVLHFSIETKF